MRMKKTTLRCLLLALALVWTTTLTTHAGWIKRYLYYDMPGTTVAELLYGTNYFGTVIFPDTPSEIQFIPYLSTGPHLAETDPQFQNAFYDNYGSYVPGYIEPPVTGEYIFWVCGDDETQLWLTTDAADSLNPAKKQLIASVPGWSNARDWAKYPEQQSAPVSLEKGKQYYLEILHKEGTGGDNIGWGWQLPSGELERPMPTFYLQPTLSPSDPTVVAGPYAAAIVPSSPGDYITIYDGMEVMLFADLNLAPPYTVQWRRGSTDITGANQTYHRFRARSSDNGVAFSVRVNGTLYGPVTLSVQADNIAPELVSATVAPSNPTQIRVAFSEQITAASATSPGNYVLSSGAVQSAQLQADGRTVILNTGLLAPGVLHVLTINGIQDMALPPNTIANTQTNLLIADGAISFRAWDFRPTDLPTLRRWSNPQSTALSYVNDLFTEERVITTTSYQWNLAPARDNFSAQMIGYLTAPETGYYKFAIASDDHSILYLGTSDQRSSKREICYYNGSTGQWNIGAQLANQQSALIWLEAGKQYYIEAVYRDGTGGDGVSVFWQTPSGSPLPTENASVQATTQPFLIPASQLSTFANPPVPGGISHRTWDAAPTDLATLRTWSNTNSVAPSYTNDMFVLERTVTTNSYPWNLVPLQDNYLGQIIGYLTAPETGNYRFGIASDDHSILYLGTTDQRSSKREICNYNGSTGRWNLGAQGNQLSGTIALEAGKRYYIEAVYRDGTGGDGVTLAWFTPSMATAGQPFPPNPANNEAATRPYIIPAMYVSTFNTYGNVFLTSDLPATVIAPESAQPRLSVVADGTRPYTYTWYMNGEVIPGAAAASYTLPVLRPADNNAQFAVVVSNNFSSITSVVATLTVTADTMKPFVASVGSLFKQTVEVQLSEPVATATATATANYLLFTSTGAPVAVNSATVDVNDATHITLQTAAMPETDAMTLVVQNLADLSTAANVMDPSTNAFRANNFDLLTRINNSQAFSARAVGDQILMTAGGSDIWGTADQFAFLSKTVTGNFDYRIQGLSLPTVNQWCKMGLMARPSTAAGARNAFTAFTPLTPSQNTYTPQIRDLTGGASTSSDAAGVPLNLGLQGGVVARPTVVYPSWLRLQRIGDTFYWYYGTTGTNWTLWTYYDSSLSGEGPLPATLEVGLALTSHDTTLTVDGVMASFTAVNDGALHFTLQPTNSTVVEGGTVNFYAAAGGSTPYLYQWLTNGTPIADGITTNATLTLARVPFTFNGLQIACRVSNPYGQVVTTANALLTVTQDGDRPTVRYYITPKININPTEVKLLFSEWMDITSAQNTANYQITTSPGGATLNISGAVLGVDERTVTLITDPQTPGTTYKVVVNNVVDLACCPPNAVAPNSTDYFFYAGAAPQYAQRADGYIIMEAENAQEVVMAGDGDLFELRTTAAGYSGSGYMLVPNGAGTGGTGGSGTTLFGTGSALVFHLNMTQVGRHIIWVRGWNENTATAGNDDSIFVGFNDAVGISDPSTDYMVGMSTDVNQSQLSGWPAAGWQWRSDRATGSDPLTFTNTSAGLHRFIIWQREDGTLIDKIVIEAGNRAAGNTAAPAPATANGGLGEPETWDFLVPPPSGPTITISSPVNNQAFPANATIPITAALGGPTPIVLVEFFQGTNLLGTATAEPFSLNWPTVPEGIYSLTARATDGLGNQTTSPAVQVIVDSTKPVAYTVGSLHGNGIGVYFSDLSGVAEASASDTANYTVNGGAITVTSATLEPDLRAVMLSLSGPVSGAFSVEVKNVTDRGAGPNVMDTVTLQSTVVTWPFNQDVGTFAGDPPVFTDPLMSGFAQAIGTDGFYVRAGGSDIWNTADGMHFVHQTVTGDFDVKVRVDGLTRPNEWAKAGLMVREDLDGNSRNYLVAATPTAGQNLITMQWRLVKGAASASIADASRPRPSPIPNAWLRITRTGDALAFYWGTDGVNWLSLYNETPSPAYPETVYVGLATTSHDNGVTLANTASTYYRDLSGLPAISLPELSIGLSGTDVVISWTSSESNLELWATEDLAPANWQPTGATPVAVGDTYTVTIPLTGVDRYFRLVQP